MKEKILNFLGENTHKLRFRTNGKNILEGFINYKIVFIYYKETGLFKIINHRGFFNPPERENFMVMNSYSYDFFMNNNNDYMICTGDSAIDFQNSVLYNIYDPNDSPFYNILTVIKRLTYYEEL